MPIEEDIQKAYDRYPTHAALDPVVEPHETAMLSHRAANLLRSAYRAYRFDYGDGAGKPLRRLLAVPILLTRIECDSLDIPLRYLAVPGKGRMLDVGCSDGYVLKVAEELGWNAEGVDFDPQAVAYATRKGLKARLGRLADQHLPDDSFDLVLMSHVIEHVHHPVATLDEIRRVLRPGGMLVVTTPNADSWGHRHFGRFWRGLEPPRHLNIFTAANLLELASQAGFADRTVASTLRITEHGFVQSRLVRRTGCGEHGHTIPLRDAACGRR